MLLPALFSWLAGVAGICSALSEALAPLLGCAAGVALPGSALTRGASSTFMGSAPTSVLTAAGACPLSTTVQPAAQDLRIMPEDATGAGQDLHIMPDDRYRHLPTLGHCAACSIGSACFQRAGIQEAERHNTICTWTIRSKLRLCGAHHTHINSLALQSLRLDTAVPLTCVILAIHEWFHSGGMLAGGSCL